MATAGMSVPRRRLARLDPRWGVPVVLAVWLLLWVVLRGHATLALDNAELTSVHLRLNRLNDAIGASRNSNPVFVYFLNDIRSAIDAFVTFIQHLISQPSADRPVPQIGWLGVVAIATTLAYGFGNWRVALLTAAGFVLFGLQGLWQESMDTLALTLATVLLTVLFGLPLGIWAGVNRRVDAVVTPVLDFMQTMPSYVYLAPLALFFLIGPASAVIATFIYAIPPIIRITAHGIRDVDESTVEAARAMGSTRWQILTRVQLPMAKRTIVVGLNQTIMAALSMVTIAALIAAPGVGQTIIRALTTLKVGVAFNAGLAIVVMAIVLDRTTTAASQRARPHRTDRAGGRTWFDRRLAVLALTAVTIVCVYLSHTYVWAATFPGTAPDLGGTIISAVDSATNWVQLHLAGVTGAFKDVISYGLLNPLQAVLAEGPWYLTGSAVVLLSLLLGGRVAALVTAGCLGLIVALGVWYDAMFTLAATLVATVIVMLLGVVVGVWMARSAAADRVIRPVLDAGQTMPAFVYLVPFLGLFGASRLTAITAAVVYAAPAAVKLVADAVRGVSPSAVEAATASGSTTWQIITKVQLPMARRGLALAANQGIIYVLSMVVVGGLVGAGALGYDVVAGFAQISQFGKGLAAGAAIVLLGVLLDRTARAAANRTGRAHH
ncbi:ABC transporter permease subunit [Dactylosporangium cerinum]|uniref:ABC transporter permease subunit n=1 Tax=Dactylosporangium cerinum TaxID=1434730 RepID=A0ABV9VMS5_9ACTN